MNELQQAQELLRNLIQAVQEVVASGEQIPDDVANQIAEVIVALTKKIETLKGAAQAPIPEMSPGAFPSSNVNGFKYNPKTQELYVQFHGPYPQAAGPIYKYGGVPEPIFNIVARGAIAPRTSGQNRYHRWVKNIAPSLGASVYALIREGGYPYQRMS